MPGDRLDGGQLGMAKERVIGLGCLDDSSKGAIRRKEPDDAVTSRPQYARGFGKALGNILHEAESRDEEDGIPARRRQRQILSIA